VLRYAAEPGGTVLEEPLELITLSGTLSADGAHLHASVADARGHVRGGHVMPGCIVRTTAEIVLAALPGWAFTRARRRASRSWWRGARIELAAFV
jgi:predicted DNA-binding protein with PD1-like motif